MAAEACDLPVSQAVRPLEHSKRRAASLSFLPALPRALLIAPRRDRDVRDRLAVGPSSRRNRDQAESPGISWNGGSVTAARQHEWTNSRAAAANRTGATCVNGSVRGLRRRAHRAER